MKRRIMTSMLIVALLMVVVLPSVASAATVKMAYASGTLNVRSGPGTTYSVNGYVKNGDYITVVSKGETWSKIQTWGGVTGYIKNLYIDDGDTSYASGTTNYSSGVSGRVKTKYAGNSVHLRSGASTSTASMGTLKNGTAVTILGENGNWYLVRTSNGTQGYMHKNYVSKGSSSSSSSTTPQTAKVTGSVVNMRSGAGTNYKIITALVKGTVVKVLSKGASWSKVSFSSYTGYMYNKYLA